MQCTACHITLEMHSDCIFLNQTWKSGRRCVKKDLNKSKTSDLQMSDLKLDLGSYLKLDVNLDQILYNKSDVNIKLVDFRG